MVEYKRFSFDRKTHLHPEAGAPGNLRWQGLTGNPSAPTSWHGRLRFWLKRNGLMTFSKLFISSLCHFLFGAVSS
jgi:hypothetical protein